MGRTLFVHVGHPKTGSSYIQSVMARNQARLIELGVFYPPFGNMAEVAAGRLGRTDVGNGVMLRFPAPALPDVPAETPEGAHILFSSEILFHDLMKNEMINQIFHARDRYGAERVVMVLFIRNPISDVASQYQQGVKRHGFTGTIDEFAGHYCYPKLVQTFLHRFETLTPFAMEVRNFDVSRKRLKAEMADLMGVDGDALEEPPNRNVNRSMTHGELHIQRALNRVFGDSGHLASDVLCDRLPDIRPATIWPSHAAQRRLLEKMADAMAFVNARVPEAHRYVADFREDVPEPPGELTFSREQIDVVMDTLATALKAASQSKNND